ncbi:MAG: PD40 domain-containing protein [Victivallales bacterium]|nr:PD40 domain-containing protein [Victivallales bacterium]
MKRICLIIALTVSACLFGQGRQHTTVTASIADNPSLCLQSCSGPQQNAKMLESALQACGWFRVVPRDKAQKVSIRVEAICQPEPGNCRYEARVTPAGKEPFTVTGNDSDPKAAALKLTDAILGQLFRIPPLCSRRIAYVTTGRHNLKEIFTCWLDGTGQQRLTNNNAISTEPAWGHSGALVYTLAKHNMLSVVLVDTQNNRQRVVSQGKGLNASAALSANGKYLALPVSGGHKVDLVVKDLSNGKSRRLTDDVSVESSPCWSPDGQTLCYVSDKLGRPQLFLVAAGGGSSTRLSLGGNECVSPDWSRVSNRLCYCTRSNTGQYVIAVLDMRNPKQPPEIVTGAAGDWEAPSWAPDGRHLVCTRSTGRSRDLYIVDTWLKSFRPLSQGANLALPAWQP